MQSKNKKQQGKNKTNKKKGGQKSEDSGEKVTWTDDRKKLFISALLAETAKGTFVDSGFKSDGWNRIMIDYTKKSGCSYTKQQLQSQFASFKAKYRVFTDIKNQSGFGWDDVAKIPTAPPEVWKRYIDAHPKAAEFKDKTLIGYDDLEKLFTGKVATGQFARASIGAECSELTAGGAGADGGIIFEQEEAAANDDDFYDDDEDGDEASVAAVARNVDDATPRSDSSAAVVRGRPPQPPPAEEPRRIASSAAGHKRIRKRSHDEVVAVLGKLVTNQEKETALTMALKLFTSKYATDHSVKDRLKVKAIFADNLAKAEMFLELDEDERQEFIISCLE